jgi:DNA-binding beta-propeller fold protein YncE
LVDVATIAVLSKIAVGKDPNWVDFTSDGNYAVVSITASNDVSIVQMDTKKVVASIKVGKGRKRLAVGDL